jgi:hypothetical protein
MVKPEAGAYNVRAGGGGEMVEQRIQNPWPKGIVGSSPTRRIACDHEKTSFALVSSPSKA